MRGRSREQAPLPLGKPVPVRLNGEDREAKGHRLAVIGHAIRGYKRKLRVDGRDTKKAITNLEKERDNIEDALIADEELRMQGDISFEEKQRSTQTLADVEAIAQGANAPPPPHTYVPTADGACYSCKLAKDHQVHKGEVAHPEPPKKGNGAAAAKPSEPHVFAPTGDKGTAKSMCKTCGAGKLDPVHIEAPAEKKAPTKLKGVDRPESRS